MYYRHLLLNYEPLTDTICARSSKASHCAAIHHIAWTLEHDMKKTDFYLILYTVVAVHAICFNIKKNKS
jgi:hypothetical protein